LKGTGIDLGAGNLWAVPHLLALGGIERLYCLEYSKHRLFKLGPELLQHYGVPPERVVLVLGDIHHIQLPDGSLDFVFMSAAFHHSDNPSQLLAEIRRVLKPSGFVVLIGEHITEPGVRATLRHMAKFAVARLVPRALQQQLFGRVIVVERFVPTQEDLLAGDERLGDHAYTRDGYHQMFSRAGFEDECLRRPHWPYQAFVLAPGRN
jgi:ubiquinone/menaquinone biosynthesis C-methylase UbiE